MPLDREIEIRTGGYAMSIGEWISLYEHSEIDIHPEFQRFYRWNSTQKSNLVESILLGVPIPPIFVSQGADGVCGYRWSPTPLDHLPTCRDLKGRERGQCQASYAK